MSYRSTDSEPKLETLRGELQNQEALIWDIKLGSIEKESVNSLVSETLVSLKETSDALLFTQCIKHAHTMSIPNFVSACPQQSWNHLAMLFETKLEV